MMRKYDKQATDENVGKSLSDDIPKRNQKLNNFIRLLNSTDTNQIVSIDGPWGCGTTFFVRQLIYLHNHDFEKILNIDQDNVERFKDIYLPIYYNAWENDYHCDPLESLTKAVVCGYAKMKSYLRNSSAKIGKVLAGTLKTVANTAIDRATCSVINSIDFDTLSKGEFDQFIKNVKEQDNKKHEIEGLFRDILKNDKRILLIIDDLDRCKPEFAVRMLETVKHFYNNSRITILVVTNNQQLASNVEHYYGQGTNGYK